MLGAMFNDKECREFDYILRKELDELNLDLSDTRLDQNIKNALAKRYKVIFNMYSRFASKGDLAKYAKRI
ncbi:hypothetical protein D3C87_82500 [compost metagenome]